MIRESKIILIGDGEKVSKHIQPEDWKTYVVNHLEYLNK